VLALIEATGVVGANERAATRPLQLFLEGITQRLFAIGIAAAPLVPGLSNISAHEDMVVK
jgi:hypothetical protein